MLSSSCNLGCERRLIACSLWRVSLVLAYESHQCDGRVAFRLGSIVRTWPGVLNIRLPLPGTQRMKLAELLISTDRLLSSLLWEKFGKVGVASGVARRNTTPSTLKPNN